MASDLEKDQLRLVIDFKPGATDLGKAVDAFKATIAFRDLCDALAKQNAPDGSVTWDHSPVKFDGDDVGAQPIFDALLAAYEKGLTRPPALPSAPSVESCFGVYMEAIGTDRVEEREQVGIAAVREWMLRGPSAPSGARDGGAS